MKRRLFFIIAASAVIFSSCKKYLEADSPSNFIDEEVFSNETDAKKAVNMVYALFNQDAFTSRVSNNFAGNTDVEVGPVGGSPDNSRRDIWSFECTPSNPDLLTVWNNAYSAINKANECESGLLDIALAKEPGNAVYNNLLGEVKTLRAYWYYLLMNHWGDVPFPVKPSRAGDDFYLPRTGRDSILSFLINDLISIESKMQWADQLDFGIERVNREFTMGMIARLALMRGGYWLYPDMTMKRKDDYLEYYKIANEYCKKLVSLKPRVLGNYATVFMNENKYLPMVNDDVLYEVAFNPGFGDVGWSVGVAVTSKVGHAFGTTTIQMSLTPAYYHSFDTTDLRLPATCSLISYGDSLMQNPNAPTSISINKWNRLLVPSALGESTSKGTGINWPMMRYADVLLMLAESENELNGPTTVAQDALRKVRQRAFPSSLWGDKVDNYIASVSGGKDNFFNAIVNERAWEFGGEFLRKFDLERWNLFGKKVAETRNTLIQMGQDAVNGTGTYSSLPDYMYYYKDGKTITFVNKYSKAATAPAGASRINWGRALWNTTTNAPADYTNRQYRGYTDNTGGTPLRYILPLHNGVISSSKGSLENQYGY
ncbi:RagB/SusD family nutrient uptake outer membrane protein [Terrimonas pollutisoli]|uniref:RagB/SusD family nutrient uptake outer membrane protein n=1 Tax=Terrimonas pollutisoli TaxID=3034147 RepID=UPI0023EE2864|nr:RagB/SusD family nutrient uptake outer membrane protein [Terrimonas sp. H1YJ31]